MLSLIGLLCALALLIVLTVRGMNLFVATPLCALLVAVSSGLPLLPQLAGEGQGDLVGVYMSGFTGFIASWFFMFLLGSIFGKLAGIQFSDWNTGVTRVRCVNLDNCSRIAIGDSTFLGQEFGFGPALVPASGFGAMRVDAIQDVRVHNCLFEKWANATANSRTIFFTTTFQSLMVEACSFLDCGGYSIVNNAGLQLGVTIDDCNHWTGDGANENFADVRNCLSPRVTNCKGTVTAGSPNVLIIFDQNNFLFMGNLAPSSNIDADGSGATGRGFNEAGQDLNLVNAYVP